MGSRKFFQNNQGQPDPKGAKMRKQGHLPKKKKKKWDWKMQCNQETKGQSRDCYYSLQNDKDKN